MRISSKGRYAVASMIYLAQKHHTEMPESVLEISKGLGISKIYLEQVFSLLKNAALVNSVKGAGGGYRLSSDPDKISIYEVLLATEFGLFERTLSSVREEENPIEQIMQHSLWGELDKNLKSTLSKITLAQLAQKANDIDSKNYMFFI
jgi:Rrf2 family transcriptional regulator, cysteine metabolism repressor